MICAVITPIGPGHEALFREHCAPSVERAIAYSTGPFDEVRHYAMDDTEGRHGRSARRNEAIARAEAEGVDWLFFLDADDFLAPNAFEALGQVLDTRPELDAVFGLLCSLNDAEEPELRDPQPPQIDSFEDLLRHEPFVALTIGHFVRTEAAAAIGFDTEMDTGEDFKYYYALWKRFTCAKVPQIFFVVRRGAHSQGPRSATGAQWTEVTARLWAEEVRAHGLWAEIPDAAGTARMRVANPVDLIQSHYLSGRYFEEGSLEALKRLLPAPAPHIVEVGANIGNHVVWYARNLGAERIYPVEPNPEALEILRDNIAANGLEPVIDPRGLGKGAGREAGRARIAQSAADNLGATRLAADDAGGGLEIVPVDDLIGDGRCDMIKIDAEGMEFDVLDGARGLIAREKPLIWVEVERANMLRFAQDWCRENGYRIVESVPYVNTIDYFAMPRAS